MLGTILKRSILGVLFVILCALASMQPASAQTPLGGTIPPTSDCYGVNTPNTGSFDHLFVMGQQGNLTVLWQNSRTTASIIFCDSAGVKIDVVEPPTLDLPANPAAGQYRWDFDVPKGTKYFLLIGVIGEYQGINDYTVVYSYQTRYYQDADIFLFLPHMRN